MLEPPINLPLPVAVRGLVIAREAVREHYKAKHSDRLKFTFDGNLVGDIGEALAAEWFGVTLGAAGTEGADGTAQDGRTVQVKATGVGRGVSFRATELHAEHLLVFSIDFGNCSAAVTYNGPEAPVRAVLGESWPGQKAVSMARLRALNAPLARGDRLPLTEPAER